MRLLKQAMAALGTVVVIAILVVLVTPKTAHALVATLIRDVDNVGRHPFSATCANSTPTDLGLIPLECGIGVPAGEEVVVQSVSVSGFEDASSNVLIQLSSTAGGQKTYEQYALQTFPSVEILVQNSPFAQQLGFGAAPVNYSDSRNLTFSADPQQTGIVCGAFGARIMACEVEGYYVTLP